MDSLYLVHSEKRQALYSFNTYLEGLHITYILQSGLPDFKGVGTFGNRLFRATVDLSRCNREARWSCQPDISGVGHSVPHTYQLGGFLLQVDS